MRASRGFTLIELLIVIAIVAVLAVTVILTLNPAELLKQARDSTRMSDLATLEKALALYQTENASSAMGSSSVVYISLPDSSSSCANLSLPTLPSGWAYRCATTANLRKTDGTGWVPINFSSGSSGNPLSALPTDPVNTVTGSYYSFVASSTTWEVTARLEASKYTSVASNDGGFSLASIERGTDLRLTPQVIEEYQRDSSLIGYWAFEETAGLTANDWSTKGSAGTLTGTITRHTGSNCKFASCIYLNGTNDQVIISNAGGALQPAAEHAISMWFRMGPTHQTYDSLFSFNGNNIFDARMDNTSYFISSQQTNLGNLYISTGGVPNLQDDAWHHYVKVYSLAGGYSRIYVDGVLRGQTSIPSNAELITFGAAFAIGSGFGNEYFNGYIDEFRFYNRALTQSEIATLYAGQ